MAIPLLRACLAARSGAAPCPYANPRFSCAFTLGALAHLYVGARLIPDGLHHGPSGRGRAGAGAVLHPDPAGHAGRSRRGHPWGDRIAWVGLITMGLFSSLFVFTVLRDALLLILWLAWRA